MKRLDEASRGHCKRCGMCCRAIVLGATRIQLEAWRGHNPDAAFVLKNWQEISRIEAYQINSHLTHWGPLYRSSFWRCKLLKDNKCTIHDKSPEVCQGFPWYGKALADLPWDPLYSPRCGFQVDQRNAALIKSEGLSCLHP
jgi:Fe-S-cluster containining protein